MAFNHPLYIGASADRVQKALEQIPESRRSAARVVFTAHSIPLSMAENCKYETQLKEASRLIMEAIGQNPWDLVYQSRSGPPQQPWLDPDICDHIQALHDAGGIEDIVIMPVGFVSDHMEVCLLYTSPSPRD